MKKQSLLAIGLAITGLLLSSIAVSQSRPYINSIDPTTANVGETVTIVGSGFPTNAANLVVSFGGVKASVNGTPTANLIQVTVPAGAQYDEVMVTDISTGLSASSREQFQLSFGGDTFSGLSNTEIREKFDAVLAAPTGATAAQSLEQPFDLCLCDFDGDGLQDVVVTSQENGPGTTKSRRVVFRNTSTVSATSFVIDEELRNQASRNVNCKDLDGDGKPDLVVSEVVSTGETGTEDIEVYLNQSSVGNISFSSPIFLSIPTRSDNVRKQPTAIEIADLDLDGKNDIISSSQNSNILEIFRNTSTISSLSFANSITEVSLPDADSYSREFYSSDLNKDGLVDLIIVQTSGTDFYYCQNESTAGSIQFKDPVLIPISGSLSIQSVATADLNGDGFDEIILSDGIAGTPGELIIAKNTTLNEGDDISFGDISRFNTSQGPYGISAGDLDGDGDIDIALGVVTDAGFGNNQSLDIFVNSSTSSTINLTRYTLLLSERNSRNTRIADINGDAKPDILAATNSLADTQGSLSVFTNRNCVTPEISPSSDVFCPGSSYILTATPSINSTYIWQVSANGGLFVTKQTSSSNTFDISGETTDIQVRVQMISNDASCDKTSTVATFTLNTNTPSNPTITASNSVCEGSPITLNSNLTSDQYFWTGPNGFTSDVKSPTIAIASAASAGTYTLQIQASNGCKSQPTTSTVTVIATPEPNFTNTGEDAFCDGNTTVLETTDFPGYSRVWNLNGAPILGQTGTTLTVSQSGNYSLTLTDDANSCSNTSTALALTQVSPPTPTITGDDEICTDVQYDLTSNVTGSAQYGYTYQWSITDASSNQVASGTTESLSHTFTAAGTYTATLTTAYQDVSSCSNQVTKTITATAPAAIPITAAATIKCASDSVLLEMPTGMTSYDWSTGDTDNDAYAKTAEGESSVTVSVTVETPIGCTINSEATISNYTDGGVTISSSDLTITDGILTVPAGTKSIQLQANGGSNYQWSPAEIFDDATAASVIVRPRSVSTEIVLEGTDINTCEESDTLQLVNDNVQARGSFSPNGDNLGFECWEILNSSSLDGCTLYILDKRGRTIFQADSPFENDCAWNGIDVDGKPAPEGVYYYVFECSDSELNSTGSILLGR